MLSARKGSQNDRKLSFTQRQHPEYTVRRSSRAHRLTHHIAGVAELVDAPDSKSGFFTEVGVRFPPSAPTWN